MQDLNLFALCLWASIKLKLVKLMCFTVCLCFFRNIIEFNRYRLGIKSLVDKISAKI